MSYSRIGTRLLGVGLAAGLAVVTIVLAATGRLQLYINPEQAWFAVGMSVLALVGAVCSFALPLGAEDDHGHSHDPAEPHPAEPHSHDPADPHPAEPHAHPARQRAGAGAVLGTGAVVAGGAVATAVVVGAMVLPPAPLSVELAMARDTGSAPLFAGADEVTLAASANTDGFGVGDWANVFETASNPDAFVGTTVELTGYVTPGKGDAIGLGRLVITHCVIDAQPATVPVAAKGDADRFETGQWVTVTGTVTATSGGALVVEPTEITPVDAPEDPYEY